VTDDGTVKEVIYVDSHLSVPWQYQMPGHLPDRLQSVSQQSAYHTVTSHNRCMEIRCCPSVWRGVPTGYSVLASFRETYGVWVICGNAECGK